MKIDANSLPNDPEQLKEMLLELQQAMAEKDKALVEKDKTITEQAIQINQFIERYEIAKRIQSSLANHCVAIKDKEVCMTLSMGISLFSDKHKSFNQLINDADKAMYRAKKNGRNRIEVMHGSQLH